MHSSPPSNRLFLACLWQLAATELQTCSTSLWSALRPLHCTIQHSCLLILSSVTFVLCCLHVCAAALAASPTFDERSLTTIGSMMNAHCTGAISVQAVVLYGYDLWLECLSATPDSVACICATLQCQLHLIPPTRYPL